MVLYKPHSTQTEPSRGKNLYPGAPGSTREDFFSKIGPKFLKWRYRVVENSSSFGKKIQGPRVASENRPLFHSPEPIQEVFWRDSAASVSAAYPSSMMHWMKLLLKRRLESSSESDSDSEGDIGRKRYCGSVLGRTKKRRCRRTLVRATCPRN